MSVPLIPWEPHVFPNQLQEELKRRETNRSFEYIDNMTAAWESNSGDGIDWNSYRGPMTSWARVCSNGIGLETRFPQKRGFVMYGGKDFYSAYGFNQTLTYEDSNESLIGYTPEGEPHVVVNDVARSKWPIHVPPPEVEKISANIQKELLRRVTIEWTCFSFKQLEYMTPYLLVPGITCIVEWGWNHFNPKSLLDLTDVANLKKLNNNPYPLYTDNILGSKGNYEVVFGIITNFEWSIEGNKIRCKTEVTSKDRLYAGLVVNSNMTVNDETSEKQDEQTRVVDSLQKFVDGYIDKFKAAAHPTGDTLDAAYSQFGVAAPELLGFTNFLRERHPDTHLEYLFGVFAGRNKNAEPPSTIAPISTGNISIGSVFPIQSKTTPIFNNKDDFDAQSGNQNELWLNMGLVVEIINYHCKDLKGTQNVPLFSVDVDDCIITGHPNLISGDGKVLLIPNKKVPKYFVGQYSILRYNNTYKIAGQSKLNRGEIDPNASLHTKTFEGFGVSPSMFTSTEETQASQDEVYNKMKKSTYTFSFEKRDKKWALDHKQAPNWRLFKVCWQPEARARRDDIDQFINMVRYKFGMTGTYEFPFFNNYNQGTRNYDSDYTGLFKNLYLNAKHFKTVLQDSNVKTFPQLYERLLKDITTAASEFWDLRLVASTGSEGDIGKAAGMKIVDYKLNQYTANGVDNIYTFDYYGADSVLQAINFRPTLSNAQAIRTIYAQTNADPSKQVVLDDKGELLDYKFHDRLFESSDKAGNRKDETMIKSDSFTATMNKLQNATPIPGPDGALQMTTGDGVFRLAIPAGYSELLTLLINDGDKDTNPRYSGIMPGIQAEFTLQGIAGIRTFAMFLVRGLPEPYSEENVVFRVVNVNDSVQNGNWTTTIVAGVIPLRGYFRSKLRLPLKRPDKND